MAEELLPLWQEVQDANRDRACPQTTPPETEANRVVDATQQKMLETLEEILLELRRLR